MAYLTVLLADWRVFAILWALQLGYAAWYSVLVNQQAAVRIDWAKRGFWWLSAALAAGFWCMESVIVDDTTALQATLSACVLQASWIAGQLPVWFASNNWNLVTHYGMNNSCLLQLTGVSTAVCAVVIITGRAITGQTRPCANAANCLEDAENANSDAVYVRPSAAINDRMVVRCSAVAPCPPVP